MVGSEPDEADVVGDASSAWHWSIYARRPWSPRTSTLADVELESSRDPSSLICAKLLKTNPTSGWASKASTISSRRRNELVVVVELDQELPERQ